MIRIELHLVDCEDQTASVHEIGKVAGPYATARLIDTDADTRELIRQMALDWLSEYVAFEGEDDGPEGIEWQDSAAAVHVEVLP